MKHKFKNLALRGSSILIFKGKWHWYQIHQKTVVVKDYDINDFFVMSASFQSYQCHFMSVSFFISIYDNACNMSGKYRGLQARIMEINTYAEYISCFTRSLYLVAKRAVECCIEYIHFFSVSLKAYIHSFLFLPINGAFIQKHWKIQVQNSRFWRVWLGGLIELMQQRNFYMVFPLTSFGWHLK